MSRWRRSSAAAADPKAMPGGIGDTFFAASVPNALRDAVPLMHDMDEKTIQRIATASLRSLCEDSARQDGDDGAAASLFRATKESEVAVTVFTAVTSVLRRAVRNHVKATRVEEDLRRLNVPAHCVRVVVDALKRGRGELQGAAMDGRLRFPHLTSCDWRCDVTISTSATARVMRPSVLMRLTLSDGTIKTFEVSLEEFHKLRYNVARVLKEMRDVEAHPIMRLAFDIEHQEHEE